MSLSVQLTRALTALALALAGAAPAAALGLDIRDVRWGLDGTVTPQRIQPLWLRLRNDSPERFRGEVRILRNRDIIARQTEIDPGAERWVRFAVLVEGPESIWRFEEQAGERVTRQDLPPPKLGAPARIFVDEQDPPRPAGDIPGFPAERFPDSVILLSGLREVLLAHSPSWTDRQAQALRDWVAGGGILHLCLRDDGRPVELRGALAPLNLVEGEGTARYGAGVVARVDALAFNLSHDALADHGYPRALFDQQTVASRIGPEVALTSVMRDLVPQPKHRWRLVATVVGLYILAAGPLCLWLGRWRRATGAALAVFLTGTALASALLYEVGRAGRATSELAASIAYARVVDGALDVTRWTNLYTISGGPLGIAGEDGEVFANAPFDDARPAKALLGAAPSLQLNLPVLSHHGFVSRSRQPFEEAPVAVSSLEVSREGGSQLAALELDIPKALAPRVSLVRAIYAGQVYTLWPTGPSQERFVLTNERQGRDDLFFRMPLANVQVTGFQWESLINPWGGVYGYRYKSYVSPAEVRESQLYGLMLRAADLTRGVLARPAAPMRGAVDIFVLVNEDEAQALPDWEGTQKHSAVVHLTVYEEG